MSCALFHPFDYYTEEELTEALQRFETAVPRIGSATRRLVVGVCWKIHWHTLRHSGLDLWHRVIQMQQL